MLIVYHFLFYIFYFKKQIKKGQEFSCPFNFKYYLTLAPPSSIAFLETSSATTSATLSSNADGITYSSFNSSSETNFAIPTAAAIFMPSVILLALTFKAPLNMPGNANTLLIWLGASDLPVPTTLAPAAFAFA